jgi:streptogramin lyase
VRKVAPDGTISTVASGRSTPNDVVLGPDGVLHATDYGNNRIVRLGPAGAATTVATADGPNSVAVAPDRTVYATERTNPWVLRVDPATGAVTRLPG